MNIAAGVIGLVYIALMIYYIWILFKGARS